MVHNLVEREVGVLERREGLGALLRRLCLGASLLQVGAHHPAEFGQVRVVALAVEQRPAKLAFQGLYGPGEGGLGDVALLCRTGEIERLAQRKKIASLIEFHQSDPSPVRSGIEGSCTRSTCRAIL